MLVRAPLALAVGPLTAVIVASAASLGGLSSHAEGAGDALVARCDTAVSAAVVASGTTITAIDVSDIAAPACVGGELSLVVTASGTEITRGGPVIVTGSSLRVPVLPADASTATDVRIVINGP